MAECANYKITKNENIAKETWLMRLEGPTGSLIAPGQFVDIKLDGFYLRRPLSVCRWGGGWLDIIYKVVGGGTAAMAAMAPGGQLELLCGLGNGFDVAPATGKRVVLAGGGVGTPPLYGLAQALCAQGGAPMVALGFASAADAFFVAEFEALGCEVHLATDDGSAGQAGFVTNLLDVLAFDYYYTCGPSPMLRAVHALCEKRGVPGQLSFEERMGCGFGVCMGCSCHTKGGAKKVCADGPVFTSGEVVFE